MVYISNESTRDITSVPCTMSKAGHYRRLFDKSTMILSIDIVCYRLLMNRVKYICRSVVVGLKFVTDKVELSIKTLEWHCRSVIVGLNFEIDKVVLSMKNICVIVGPSLLGSCL